MSIKISNGLKKITMVCSRTDNDIQKIISANKEIFATKEDLANFATKEDLAGFATKEDLKTSARKLNGILMLSLRI